MSSDPVTPEDLRGVFAVPPLPRKGDARRTLDLDEAERVAAHVARGGITRLLYGGNAFLYHVMLDEYDPGQDAYLDGLLRRVERGRVVSGIGERPAVVHARRFGLAGFTTGSGCLAPRLSNALLAAIGVGDWTQAEARRAEFLPLEDLRDAWGPARVLHHATELAGVARTGPIPPYVSALEAEKLERLAPVARALREADA